MSTDGTCLSAHSPSSQPCRQSGEAVGKGQVVCSAEISERVHARRTSQIAQSSQMCRRSRERIGGGSPSTPLESASVCTHSAAVTTQPWDLSGDWTIVGQKFQRPRTLSVSLSDIGGIFQPLKDLSVKL